MAKKTIKAQMKQRRDTKANWAATNPVLLDGELGIVSDDPNLYKVGDGATAWNSLPFRGFDGTLAQELGTSENAVISQKVVSEKLTELESEKAQIKVADNGNFFNIRTGLSYTDIDSNTGELKKVSNNVITSDFIVMDFSKEITTANNYPFIYCYAEDGSYLGLIRAAKAVVKETYPTTAKIRVNMFGENAKSVMVMYSDYYTGEYVPFNPIGGYTEVFEVATKDNFKKVDNKVITKG